MKIKPNKNNANQIGELLRREFFKVVKERYHGKEYDRVSWELIDGAFNHMIETKSDGYEDITFHSAEMKIGDEVIEAYWYWDEDYYLSFTFEDGSSVFNLDANKDYGWDYES